MKKRTPTTAFHFRPGWIIRDCSQATGGIHYDREQVKKPAAINAGRGIEAQHRTIKTIDNVEFCAAIDAVVKKVAYVLRKHCTRTEMGWFCTPDDLARVRAEVDAIKAEADELNKLGSTKAHSQRRAEIRIVPLKLDIACPEAVQEIATTIRSTLTDLRDALREGRVADIHKLRIRAINLDRLAVGFQSDAIRFALDRVPMAFNELRAAIRAAERAATNAASTGKPVRKAKKADAAQRAALAGAALDLEALDAAIWHFTGEPVAVNQLAVVS